MEPHTTTGHEALSQGIIHALEPYIMTVVTTALEQHTSEIARQSKEKRDKELTSLNNCVNDLKSQLAGARHENEILRKNLVALLQSHKVQENTHAHGESPSKPSSVAYITYEKLLHKVEILEQQLLESVESRKLEASARSYLMSKLKTAKATAREWIEYHERWVAKHTECKQAKPRNGLNNQDQFLGPGHNISAARPPALSPGVEAFEGLFNHDIALQGSGPGENRDIATVNQINHLEGPDQDPRAVAEHNLAGISNSSPTQSSQTLPAGSVSHQEPVVHHVSEERARAAQNNIRQQEVSCLDHSGLDDALTTPRSAKSSANRQVTSKPPLHDYLKTRLDALSSVQPLSASGAFTPAALQTVQHEDDDLVIVGERSVKRRKGSIRNPAPRIQVKQEDSSPQQAADHVLSLFRNETLDLDEVLGTVTTPRKRKANQRSTKPTTVQSRVRRRRHMSEPLETQMSLVVSSPILRPSALPAATAPDKNIPTPKTGVLSSIDPNTRLKPKPISGTALGRNTRSRAKHLIDGIASLAEDGHDIDENNHPLSPAVAGNKLKKSTAQLSSLLGPIIGQTNKEQRGQVRVGPKPPVIRLRQKPLSSLQLEDFRLNPRIDHNRLSENPVESRMCLPGCTDPRCCGEAMRALAASLKPKLQRPPFPESQEDALLSDDEYLLKWYMGSKWYRDSVNRMGPEEFNGLLLHAQTRLLAERHGKHRTEARRMTPPGFWDMDFPTTQELQKQRKEAETINRELVRDRYEEALRSGRWLFRDEL